MTKKLKMVCVYLMYTVLNGIFLAKSYSAMPTINGTIPALMIALPEEVPTGHLKHDITFNQAANMLQSFLGNSYFYNEARLHGYSGFLSKTTLNEIIPRVEGDPYTSGLLVYLCYDKRGNSDDGDDQIFLAFKRGTGFTESMEIPVIDRNETYYKTGYILLFAGNENPTLEQVKSEMSKAISVENTENATLTGGDVFDFSEEFKSRFKAVDDISNNDVYCNNYTFGFIPLYELNLLRFPEGIDQNDFMGIRFYLGFDNTENDNRIRVFFVGSKTDKNFIVSDDTVAKTQYARIIERSRP